MTLTVAIGWKGKGVDTRLLRESEAYLRSRGFESIALGFTQPMRFKCCASSATY